MLLPAPTADTRSQHIPYNCMTSSTVTGMHYSALMCKVFRVHIKSHKYIVTTMNHLTNVIIQIHPPRLPNTQSSPLPQVSPVFLSNPCRASPVIQAHLPGSPDAILNLGTCSFRFVLPSSTASSQMSIHIQPTHLESFTLILKGHSPSSVHEK